MNVSSMIKLMKTLGIGQVYSDPTADSILLEFLNLAHDELYRETANINSGIFVNDPDLTSLTTQNYVILTQTPFTISRVFPVGFTRFLDGKSVLEFADYQFINTTVGDPRIYSNIGQKLNFWPFTSGNLYTFNVWYTPERTLLDANTPESAIPYPISYQSVLIDGALYYLFQDESGFKNTMKENEALRRWTKGKADLVSYLFGSNKQKISTFENA